MSRNWFCIVRSMSVCASAVASVALVVATVVAFGAAEESSAPATSAAENSVRNHSPDTGRSDESKATTAAGGRIDGYLAGGRWREGSKLVDVAGQFKTSGERIAFHAADGKSRFACLENLNSERVARIVAESPPESLDWIVQGTLTEYRNENYLLVTQAVIGGRAARGAKSAGERRSPPAKATATPR